LLFDGDPTLTTDPLDHGDVEPDKLLIFNRFRNLHEVFTRASRGDFALRLP